MTAFLVRWGPLAVAVVVLVVDVYMRRGGLREAIEDAVRKADKRAGYLNHSYRRPPATLLDTKPRSPKS